MSEQLLLVYPGIVPIRILIRLARAGVHETRQVHEHIRANMLRSLPGIGLKYESDILRYYTGQLVKDDVDGTIRVATLLEMAQTQERQREG